MRLPAPDFDPYDTAAALTWVGNHLDGLWSGPLRASGAFTGGQAAADAALEGFEVAGYAARRNEVWPEPRRGASRLSPYIRHGLLPLPRVWRHVAGGPPRDVSKFRDELLWQEYARHLYARLGGRTTRPLRHEPPPSTSPHDTSPRHLGPDQGADVGGGVGPGVRAGAVGEPDGHRGAGLPGDMACLQMVVDELERDGWLPNQTRMWFASEWSVRRGWDWRAGEDLFFRHLLDGSRAANRLGWQWTIGTGTGRPYGFSRWQVAKRAPGLCQSCALRSACPIEDWPDAEAGPALAPDPLLRSDPDPAATSGPDRPVGVAEPEQVWLTAESLGSDDPALAANPGLPVVFVFDDVLLATLQLAAPRLVFLVQCLADLAGERELEVLLGVPREQLDGRALAATFAPVPGWRRTAAAVRPVEVHPWPWLRRPGAGSLASFTAWARGGGRR